MCGDNPELFTFLPQALLFAITQRNAHRADCANGRQFLFEFIDPPASGFFLNLSLVDSRPQRIGGMHQFLLSADGGTGGQARRFEYLFQGINSILPAHERFPDGDHFLLNPKHILFKQCDLPSRELLL